MRKFVLACALYILACSTGSAATHYVNNSGSPVCADVPGNGSLASPWCTITYGVAHISSGDTLYVRTGTYNETPLITGPAGTSANPTVISAYPGDNPIIRGPGNNNGRVKILTTSYITFNGFEVTNFNQGIFVEGADHIIVSNCSVHDIGQEIIHVHASSTGTPSTFVTLSGNTLYNSGSYGSNGEGFYIGTGDSAGSVVDQTGNVTVTGNTVQDVVDEGIEVKIGTHDVAVLNNSFIRVDTSSNTFGGAGISIDQSVGSVQHWNSNPNHIVAGNTVATVGNGTGGTLLNSGISVWTGATVYNNVVYGINSAGNGIFIRNPNGDSYPRLIYNNTVDVGSAAAITNSGATVDIRNNIGPTTTYNLATNSAYYVNQVGANYHLVGGSAPIGAGVYLGGAVPTDKDGVTRTNPPDIGAYQYVGSTQNGVQPPTGLKAIVH